MLAPSGLFKLSHCSGSVLSPLQHFLCDLRPVTCIWLPVTGLVCPDHSLNSACTDFGLHLTSSSACSFCYCTAYPILSLACILTMLLSMYLFLIRLSVSDLVCLTPRFLHILPSHPLQAPTCYQLTFAHHLPAGQPVSAHHLSASSLLLTCCCQLVILWVSTVGFLLLRLELTTRLPADKTNRLCCHLFTLSWAPSQRCERGLPHHVRLTH